MEARAVVDRIEDGARAVLLVGRDEQEWIVPVTSLPAGAGAGSWLRVRIEGDALARITLDVDETERVRQRIAEKLARLRRRGSGGEPAGGPD